MSFFRRHSDDGGRWIIAGLGNPGPKYADTRHNVGAVVLDDLVQKTGVSMKRHKSGAFTGETQLAGERVVLARSVGYMNDSGRPIGALARFYKTPPEQVIVIYDEMDIPFGDVRVKFGGGTAGHNGVKSIRDHLGTPDFVRIRTGIGRPRDEAIEHVLAKFSSSERKELPDLVGRASDAVERVLEIGVERAMNEINTR